MRSPQLNVPEAMPVVAVQPTVEPRDAGVFAHVVGHWGHDSTQITSQKAAHKDTGTRQHMCR
jgi:hypothetical protein